MPRKSVIGGVAGLISLLAVSVLSVSSLGATPLPVSGANVVWPAGTAGSTSSTGAFVCGTAVDLTMASGFANSGVGFANDWSTITATNAAFTGGITPASAVAIYGNVPGNLVTVAFGIEVTNPVVLINYIDGNSAMAFPIGTALNLLDWNSSKTGATPVVAANVISLETDTDSVNDGWAVQVAGTFGPTSGPMTFTYLTETNTTAGFSVALPSGTECTPPAPEPIPEPEPVPARFTG